MCYEIRMDYLPLEKAVMQKLLDGDHPILVALRNQVVAAKIKDRQFTGVGFFLHFEIDPKLALPGNLNLEIGDVMGTLPGVEHGSGYILFIREGVLSMLEGFTYDDPWPESISDFHLGYIVNGALSLRRDEAKLTDKLDKMGSKKTDAS
jgi:hypothetical protein